MSLLSLAWFALFGKWFFYMSFYIEVVIIGAGVVGLACARALARADYGVIVLEQHSAFGTETSSRNSEVIHAGIYYRPGSLKSKLCVSGRELLYQFCENYGVSYRQCGKLIVSTTREQEDRLHMLRQQASDNGVNNLEILSGHEATALEPELSCTAALLSPSTGIIDSHGFMLALLGDAEQHGAQLVCRTPVDRVVIDNSGFDVLAGGMYPSVIRTRYLINAAGLGALQVAAAIEGLSPDHLPQLFTAKGSYFSVSGKAPFSRLIYPTPEAGGLGVHFTLDLVGQGRFGPDVEWVDKIDYSVDVGRRAQFHSAIKQYWPAIKESMLTPAYAGIRPKLVGSGNGYADFLVQDSADHGVNGLINLFGIESPGLTAALALGEDLRRRIQR